MPSAFGKWFSLVLLAERFILFYNVTGLVGNPLAFVSFESMPKMIRGKRMRSYSNIINFQSLMQLFWLRILKFNEKYRNGICQLKIGLEKCVDSYALGERCYRAKKSQRKMGKPQKQVPVFPQISTPTGTSLKIKNSHQHIPAKPSNNPLRCFCTKLSDENGRNENFLMILLNLYFDPRQ